MAKVEREMTLIKYTKRIPGEAYAFEEIEIVETVAPENIESRLAEFQAMFDPKSDADNEASIPRDVVRAIENEETLAPTQKTEDVIEEPAPKKRGRKPKAAAPVEEVEAEQEEDDEDPLAEEPAPKKKTRTPNTPYDRDNGFHRKLLTEVLDKNVQNWKKDAAKVKAVSAKFQGVDFISGEGDVLESFQTDFLKAVKAK